MKHLKGSRTAENLLKAFAGESQARMRYTFYAKTAGKEGFRQIEEIFLETAENERMHAKLFYKHLVAAMNGEPLEIHAAYPVALDATVKNLEYAAGGEHEEWSSLYPEFARIADEEGFPEVARTFRAIARSRSGTRRATASCWTTSRTRPCSRRSRRWPGSAASAARSSSPTRRPISARSATIPGNTSRSGWKITDAAAGRFAKETDMKDMKLKKYALADLLLAAVKSEIESQAVYSAGGAAGEERVPEGAPGIPRPRGEQAPESPGSPLQPAFPGPGPDGPRKAGGAAARDPLPRRAGAAQRDLRPGHDGRAGGARFLPAAVRAVRRRCRRRRTCCSISP